ncbi:hypothetical protein BDN72DRAFT_188078 [Pluteus cervinus]|uniref:Uncharacterized protein n=1 Tax=Pluteus cervinus TaxID=181527 RepID=A0ACD3AIK3_9AGAR|nr:hypothetical protein BDN72DRAFT_188078 [Pluteus cervinus]
MRQYDSDDFDTNAKLREEIDAELAMLCDRVRILHAKRNTLSSLYRLPPELLVRIFKEHQENVVQSLNLDENEKYGAWIRVLQISQYLREIGLQSPELWSNIMVTDRRWISKSIELSRSNDLNIGVWLNDEDLVKPVKQIMAESERISALNLAIGQPYWEEFLPRFKMPAPRLTTLRLRAYIGDSDDPPSIPIDLFSGTHPRLTRLFVTSFDVDLESPLFTKTNLSNLSLISPGNVFPISEILCVLQRLPGLRSLVLRHTLATGDPGGGCPIPLPSLTSLQLEHEVEKINNDFLVSLILPETTNIDLSSFAIDSLTQDLIDSTMDSVKRATQNPSLVFREIQIDWGTQSLVMVCMKQSGSGKLSSPFVRIKFAFASRPTQEGRETWLTTLPNWLLLPIEVLRFQGRGPTSQETWDYLSRTILNLQHLVLSTGVLLYYFIVHPILQPPIPG